MNYEQLLEQYLSQLAELLVGYGVPAEQGPLAAMIAVFLGLTLVVVLLVVLLLRLRRKPAVERTAPDEEESELSEAEVAEAEAGVEVEAVAPPEVPADAEEKAAPAVEEVEPEAVVEPDKAPAAEPVVAPPTEPVEEPVTEAGLFQRLRQGLSKTRSSLLGRVDALFDGATLDDDFIEELEEILITADFGMQATQELVDALTKRIKEVGTGDTNALHGLLREEIGNRLHSPPQEWGNVAGGPLVIMVVGVNGVGKTTTIGKLAKQFTGQGKKVVLGAGDTFRAAAAEQLQIWGERSGAEVISQSEGSDPAAVAFDAAKAAVARNADVLILDTAGRLHTKVNLMEELKKVRRVVSREIPGAPHETLLVLDATTGQNALIQAKMFQEAVEVSGIALTKLDGTAKGGIVVAIGTQLGLPVRLIGVGEGVADLRPFVAEEFVEALFADV